MNSPESAHPSIARIAERGAHRGWGTFDIHLEGARFHLLQEAVEADPFDAAEAERLVADLEAFAQSYGYGIADSYLTDASGLTDDEISEKPELAAQRQTYFDEDGHEDQYFVEVRTSERLLADGAATDAAREFLRAEAWAASADGANGKVFERMHKAFIAGRDMRVAQESGPAPKS